MFFLRPSPRSRVKKSTARALGEEKSEGEEDKTRPCQGTENAKTLVNIDLSAMSAMSAVKCPVGEELVAPKPREGGSIQVPYPMPSQFVTFVQFVGQNSAMFRHNPP